MSSTKNIFYVQYTNPGGYPPLEHSSQLLASLGWKVLFLGTGSLGANELVLAAHTRIRVKTISFCRPGLFQKLHYTYYCLWVLLNVLAKKPEWIYASDSLVCPIVWILSRLGFKVIYHEHDSPSAQEAGRSFFQRMIQQTRLQVARQAYLCILPNQERLEIFRKVTGRAKQTLCVWNCPSREEARASQCSVLSSAQPLILYYHGSITPERLPLSVVDAMARMGERVHLWIAGYETIGSRGYVQKVMEYAETLKLKNCLRVLGAIVYRKELVSQMRLAHVGISFMPKDVADINMKHMTGASNKTFDYLAGGLALFVSNIPDWEEMYVRPGYALGCDPNSVDSVAQGLQWFLDHPNEVAKMGEAGRQKILSEWNYEKQFESVMKLIFTQSVFS